ncbi:MAG: ethyl tert-butyl ether degradation protein EthD [Chloroflexi bacterium]|nr:MAG: ethyl tert-butyl ether degradation protein EthD [Chloroflexota bacterium]PIE80797.1 MAG: ethyl tert-butyl ether degradation protein EthD [Chloroflexota bacterium]
MISYFKLTTLYRQVDDLGKLDEFFHNTHLPLAEQLPGLLKSEVTRIDGKPGSLQSRFYLMYELYFASSAAYMEAFATETGLALVQALMPWAEAKLVTWFYGESFEETNEERKRYC